ncbi:MAG: zinc-binding alcohol dehydrogenase family protein [Planctomycetota bacterium]
MQSLTLQSPGVFTTADVPEPTPGPGEALVEVVCCGICGTDIHAYGGNQPFFSYPRRLGHELCVRVISAPSDSKLEPGTLCAVRPYFFCGKCPACLAGKTNCCRELRVMGVHIDGGHVPRLAINADFLHPSEGLSADVVALVEPLAIGAHAVERAAIKPGEPVAIIGMGPIGLAAALSAKAEGAELVLVDRDAGRLKFASETLGLGHAVVAGEGMGQAFTDHFGQLPSCIIDATGHPASMNGCFDLAEHGGRVVFVGLFTGDLQFDDPNFHRRELTLLASRAATASTFDHLIESMQAGRIDPTPLITHRVAFEDLEQKFAEVIRSPGLIKAVIDF